MRFSPQLLIDPVLLFFLALMAGTLVVIVPNNPFLGEPDPEPLARPPVQTPPPVPARVEPAPDTAWTEFGAVSDEIEQTGRRLRELRFQVSVLDAASQRGPVEPQPAPSERNPETAALERLLREKESRVNELKTAFERTKPPYDADAMSAPPTQVSTGKPIHWFGLLKGRILPLTKEFYKVSGVPLPGGGIRATAVPLRAGLSEEEAMQPGSAFQAELAKLDTAKHAVGLNVDGISFTFFRRLRGYIRQRGFDVAWDPDTSEDGTMTFSPGGASIAPQQ